MESTDFVVECPHCRELVLIEKIDCAIFRHGALKENGKQIDPHASKELCDFYISKDLINGCGKPFKVILNPNCNSKDNDDKFIAIVCDYI
jgi:hypothetical protein